MMFVADIQRVTAEHYDIPLAEMTSDRRFRGVARPRQVAMFLAKELTPQSLANIGRMFGGRDHTTVMHAIKTIETMTDCDIQMREKVSAIKEQLLAENSEKLANLQVYPTHVEMAA